MTPQPCCLVCQAWRLRPWNGWLCSVGAGGPGATRPYLRPPKSGQWCIPPILCCLRGNVEPHPRRVPWVLVQPPQTDAATTRGLFRLPAHKFTSAHPRFCRRRCCRVVAARRRRGSVWRCRCSSCWASCRRHSACWSSPWANDNAFSIAIFNAFRLRRRFLRMRFFTMSRRHWRLATWAPERKGEASRSCTDQPGPTSKWKMRMELVMVRASSALQEPRFLDPQPLPPWREQRERDWARAQKTP